jgi:nitric oxide reductase large subunit
MQEPPGSKQEMLLLILAAVGAGVLGAIVIGALLAMTAPL